MANLKYYADERERYAEVRVERPTRAEILVSVPKLCRRFKLPEIRVEFTSGNRNSHYSCGDRHLRLNMDWADWRTVAHEMAHYMDHMDRKTRVAKLLAESRQVGVYARTQFEVLTTGATGTAVEAALARQKRIAKVQKRLWHGKVHARFTDRVFRYIQKQNWENGAIRKKLDDRQQAQQERVQTKKVERGTSEHKISLRQAQIERLERKIRALTTRLKKARRSLGALERAKAKRASEPKAQNMAQNEGANSGIDIVPSA